MINISTTSDREARAMAGLLSSVPLGLEYKIYLLGREITAPPPPSGEASPAASYSVLFPVRPRVQKQFTRDDIELAARIAFWQHPPDECEVPEQEPVLEWMKDLIESGTELIRVSGDVIPPREDPQGYLP